jgi:VWFA-related protein
MIARVLPAVVLIASCVAAASHSRAAEGPTDAEVAAAIAKGVEYLREHQTPGGAWSYQFNGQDHTVGITALAGLALLENGVDRSDRAIRKAEAVIKELAPDSYQTYDVALAILFLARVQEGSQGANDALIRRLGERLEDGEHGGMWTYQIPRAGERERAPARRRRSGRVRFDGVGDNSNTQFALLGIWGASRHGFAANDPLKAIDMHFRDSQEPSGGWGYNPGSGGSPAMTCAGLMGLAIAAARPEQAERLSAKARGMALAADPAFQEALKVVSSQARTIGPQSDIYYLWSLERVCVALGLRDLDGLNWYATGAEELLSRQDRSGGWPGGQWGTLPNTCLALLFLRKANLAFELDRVLKLPGSEPPKKTQDTPPPPKSEVAATPTGDDAIVTVRSVEEKGFPDITLDFEVKRPNGSALLDAKKEDFRVTEYDKNVEILSFRSPESKEIRPTTVVLVVDHSRSMAEENRIDGLKEAVGTFLKVMPPGSRIAVVAFNSKVIRICPFTEEPAKVKAEVDKLTPADATRYYDAVADALDLIGKESGRRAILALTDGEDTFSQNADLEKVIVAARNAGVPIHTLGLGSEDELASDDLRRLATETRGQYFPARQADQLRGIYEELAKGLGQSYSLTYRTDRKLPDGTLRPIRIYYKASKKAAETAVFIPGMVVPAAGWSRLFLVLVVSLVALAWLPGLWYRRSA